MTRPSPALEKEIRDLFSDEGVVLLQLTLSGTGSRLMLRAVGDRRHGALTISDCVRLTRDIQHLISEKRLIAGDYRMEVSSPGLDFPLTEVWQYEKNVGRLLKLTIPGEKGPREISGRLKSAQDEEMVVISEQKEWTLRYGDVLSAKVLPEFKPPRMESDS
jgi:ribosome maturation factor RimP